LNRSHFVWLAYILRYYLSIRVSNFWNLYLTSHKVLKDWVVKCFHVVISQDLIFIGINCTLELLKCFLLWLNLVLFFEFIKYWLVLISVEWLILLVLWLLLDCIFMSVDQNKWLNNTTSLWFFKDQIFSFIYLLILNKFIFLFFLFL
jgi:hypothetical protein